MTLANLAAASDVSDDDGVWHVDTGRPMKSWGRARSCAALLAAVLTVAACSSGSSQSPGRPAATSATAIPSISPTPQPTPPRMVGFGRYMEHRGGGFEATKLVPVDPG